MKNLIKYGLPFLIFFQVQGQTIVFDKNHNDQVWDNYRMRVTNETIHQNNLQVISTSIKNIELNLGAVFVIQDAVYRSLTEVNAGLKQGIMVKNMSQYTNDILKYSNEMVTMATNEPYLLLFAEAYSIHSRGRVIDMATEVSDIILKGGKELMMDFTKRDALLRKITDELVLLRGMSYGAMNAMKFAKQNGVLKKLNPLQNYINRDKQLVDEIIFKYKYIQK